MPEVYFGYTGNSQARLYFDLSNGQFQDLVSREIISSLPPLINQNSINLLPQTWKYILIRRTSGFTIIGLQDEQWIAQTPSFPIIQTGLILDVTTFRTWRRTSIHDRLPEKIYWSSTQLCFE